MNKLSDCEKVLKDDKDLKRFMRAMKKFDLLFCDMMVNGEEFTLRLEIKGRRKKLLHCRVGIDEFDRGD